MNANERALISSKSETLRKRFYLGPLHKLKPGFHLIVELPVVEKTAVFCLAIKWKHAWRSSTIRNVDRYLDRWDRLWFNLDDSWRWWLVWACNRDFQNGNRESSIAHDVQAFAPCVPAIIGMIFTQF
jgi:hypothetical protein